jgi:hypothetical protein
MTATPAYRSGISFDNPDRPFRESGTGSSNPPSASGESIANPFPKRGRQGASPRSCARTAAVIKVRMLADVLQIRSVCQERRERNAVRRVVEVAGDQT